MLEGIDGIAALKGAAYIFATSQCYLVTHSPVDDNSELTLLCLVGEDEERSYVVGYHVGNTLDLKFYTHNNLNLNDNDNYNYNYNVNDNLNKKKMCMPC